MSKIVIIGGGASGLISSIFASLNNEVILIEKNSDVGKKLLITGNGKCNYFNEDMSLKHFFTSSNVSLGEFITDKNIEKVKKFFLDIGIIPKIRNGYYYPNSNQAISIKNALKLEAVNKGVKIKTGFEVKKIEKKDKFYIYLEKEVIAADKLILSTGSKAYPKTGSDGFGYKILKFFNHNIITPLPGLVQLYSDNIFKGCHGVKQDALVSLYANNELIRNELGEILFTEYGLSGICIFNLSSFVSLNIEKEVYLKLNFVHFLNLKSGDEFCTWLDSRNKKMNNRKICDLFEGFINYKLVNFLLGKYKYKKWEELNLKEKSIIVNNFLSYKLRIIGTKSFDNSQICIGGLDLKDINLKTMESKKVKDLYITGELLDINGDCGGYNLAIAWISGILAGERV